MQFNHNTNMIPVTDVCNMHTITMLGFLSHDKGKYGLKLAQAPCSLKKSYSSFLYSLLGLAAYSDSPHWSG